MKKLLTVIHCRKCLYHMGIFKPIVCPCISCKVYGGDNPPITFKSLFDEKASDDRKK